MFNKKQQDFLSFDTNTTTTIIKAFHKHKQECCIETLTGEVCGVEKVVEALCKEVWPQRSKEYYEGLLALAIMTNSMWDTAIKVNPLLNIVDQHIQYNIIGMVIACAIKLKEIEEADEVEVFSKIEEI